jgi:sugar/nucleoside kinase (ribokinase family)
MSSNIDILVAGHICLDVHPDLSGVGRKPFGESFLPGRLIVSGPVSFSSGGSVANTGLALDRLGIHTQLVGKVGDDLFGQALRKIVAAHAKRLAESLQVDPTTHTSYSIIINYPGVDRIFMHSPGANDTFKASDIPSSLLDHIRLFHFGYPPIMRSTYLNEGAELKNIFLLAKHAGVTTSLDMAFPDPSSEAGQVDWINILRSILPLVDIFMPSVEEILFMLRPALYQGLCTAAGGSDILPLVTPDLLADLGRELIEMGAGMVGLKLGYRGLYLRSGDKQAIRSMGRSLPSTPEAWADMELWAPCFKVEVAGTTGSGDATIAGFHSALLRKLSIEEALTMAVAVGACNVEAADALSGIRTWEETTQRVVLGWERQPLMLDTPGWQFDKAQHIWRGPCQ